MLRSAEGTPVAAEPTQDKPSKLDIDNTTADLRRWSSTERVQVARMAKAYAPPMSIAEWVRAVHKQTGRARSVSAYHAFVRGQLTKEDRRKVSEELMRGLYSEIAAQNVRMGIKPGTRRPGGLTRRMSGDAPKNGDVAKKKPSRAKAPAADSKDGLDVASIRALLDCYDQKLMKADECLVLLRRRVG